LPGYILGDFAGGILAALYVSKLSFTLAKIHAKQHEKWTSSEFRKLQAENKPFGLDGSPINNINKTTLSAKEESFYKTSYNERSSDYLNSTK
jgi:hypothetical protein